MPVYCADCGEELMGIVNRCWRCGRHFATHVDPSQPPPVRGAPVELLQYDEVSEVTTGEAVAVEQMQRTASATGGRRVGSPFAPGSLTTAAAPELGVALSPASTPTDRRRRAAAVGYAVASVVLAIFAFVALFVTTIAAFPLSLTGVLMGVWGLSSDRVRVALAGLMLSCLALMITCYYAIAWIAMQM